MPDSSPLPEEVDGEEPLVCLTLRFVDASSLELRVPRGSPVLRLKQAVSAERGTPPACQRVIYLGRVLEDEELLTSAHDGKVLHCLLRTVEEQSATSTSLAVPDSPPSPRLAAAQAQMAEVDLMLVQAALLVAAQNAAQERTAGRRGASFSMGGSADQFWTGLAIGLLLGFPAMLCLMEPAASPRLRTGILCGFCLQMMLASSRLSQSVPRSREERDAEWLNGG